MKTSDLEWKSFESECKQCYLILRDIYKVYLSLRTDHWHYHTVGFYDWSWLAPILYDCSNRKSLRTRSHERSWLTTIIIRGLETPVFCRIHIELPTYLADAAHCKEVHMMGHKISCSRIVSHWIQNDSRVLLNRRGSCWISINDRSRH